MTEFRRLLKTIHKDQEGALSLETILIIGAIALPILLWVWKYGWPMVRDYFKKGIDDLKQEQQNA